MNADRKAMNADRFSKFVMASLVLAVVTACAPVPEIDAARIPAAPVQFKEGDGRWTVAGPAEAQARGEWGKAFSHPVLDDLGARAVVRGTVVAYRGTLDLTERRYRAGDVAELDVTRARTEVAATESEAIALDRRRAELEHALAVLVGEVSSNFALPVEEWKTALPVIPAGVPSTVLARRPDVSAAPSGMLAPQQRVGVAKAAWFPDVSLTGSGGYASTELGDLFKWSARAWGVGALLSLPVFDGGRRAAGVQNAGAQLDEAVAHYREQVLVAFRDVEDQLSALRLLSEQSGAQADAVASATRTTALSDARYRNGLVSQLDLLDARRSELRNRRQALPVRAAQYEATVGLVRALGGGWGGQS